MVVKKVSARTLIVINFLTEKVMFSVMFFLVWAALEYLDDGKFQTFWGVQSVGVKKITSSHTVVRLDEN